MTALFEYGSRCCIRLLIFTLSSPVGLHQGRNELFISGGGNFHEFSFDDVIVLIQPCYNFFTNGHR